LRDRRLLPLIAVLAVGIVVVPFALSKSSTDPGSVASPSPDAREGGSAAPQLAVVSNEAGIRDYRDRLGKDPSDPFRQQFTSPLLEGSELGGGTGGPTTEIGGDGAGAPTGPAGPTTPVDSGDSGDPADPSDPTQEPEPTEPAEPEPAYVVVVRVGGPDDTRTRELSEITVLPGTENPVLVFRGLNEKGNKAVFRTSSSVNAIFGDAECVEGTDRCEKFEVEPGSPLTIVYGESERLYRLTVVRIERNR
jgi:hypothetical protein